MDKTKMTSKTCKFYNTGFCKYSDACRFRHAKENCLGECDKRICEKRHPKPCKFGNGCKRGQTCCYNHLKSPKIDAKQEDMKAEICGLKKTLSGLLDAKAEVEALKKIVETLQKDNERHQLKIQNIELELEMSNCKAQLAPKKATKQDTNFGIDSTHIGKSAPKKDVKIIPSKIDVSAKKNAGRTKDLVKESLLEIRGAQKAKETQNMANEEMVTKPMLTVRASDDATGNGKIWPPFSFQQGTI